MSYILRPSQTTWDTEMSLSNKVNNTHIKSFKDTLKTGSQTTWFSSVQIRCLGNKFDTENRLATEGNPCISDWAHPHKHDQLHGSCTSEKSFQPTTEAAWKRHSSLRRKTNVFRQANTFGRKNKARNSLNFELRKERIHTQTRRSVKHPESRKRWETWDPQLYASPTHLICHLFLPQNF